MIYAILTCALHEHAYINSFVSHYVNIGFNKIYVICDIGQPLYDSYLVSNENVEVIFIHMEYPDNLQHKFDRIQIQYYNKVVGLIDADYILLCDIDEYLYIPQGTIQNYMKVGPKNVSQYCFPWMIVDSLHNDPDNIFDQLHLPNVEWNINHHFKTLFHKKSMISIKTTHDVVCRGNSFKVNHPNISYYTSNQYPFFIHFHMRSLKNNFIKMFTNKYAKKTDNEQKTIFYKLLKDEKTNFLSLRKFHLFYEHKLGTIPKFALTGLNKNILPTYHKYQDQLLNYYIQKYEIKQEYIDLLLQNPYLTVKRF